MPNGHFVGERAATDILVLARKGPAFGTESAERGDTAVSGLIISMIAATRLVSSSAIASTTNRGVISATPRAVPIW